ncbi:hypothetical protein AB0940_33535 [Streptomyces sp. NPDC006656]|uniref:hypothetical protein n=1 Tax=Streptomyces sp. NPDC006656 TaxID=3156899 RepID=UPI0034557195
MYGELWAWAAEQPARAAAAALLLGVPVAGALAQQRQADRKKTEGGSGATSDGGGGGVLARFVAGRDLRPGDPSSSASWWCAGVEVARDRTAEDIVAERSGGWETSKEVRGGVLRSLAAGAARWRCWPGAARSVVRLAVPVVAVAGWLGRWPVVAAVVGVLAVAGVLAAVTGPVGLGWWRPRPAGADLVHGPGMWAALRPVLGVGEAERRRKWLHLPLDVSLAGARVVLRLPAGWAGGETGMKAVDAIVTGRLPGEWTAHWHRTVAAPYVEWVRDAAPEKPRVLPKSVDWIQTGDPLKIYFGETPAGPAYVYTGTATPHIGVSGETGSGKSTLLYIPLVAARMAGWLVTVIDPKQNSLVEAYGKSGVRIHTETYECCMAVAEFFVSMMAAEKYNSRRYRGYVGPDAPVGRVLIIDELPSFREYVAAWWKYIVKERGFPPVLIWIQLILMQGRSSNHRVVVGTHQFSLDVFGSTMARDQVGTKMVVGEVSAPSWAVAYGVSAPLVDYDETIPGRGAISLKGRRRKKILPDGRVERAEEIQYAYITPEVSDLLDACPPAPAWWEAGAPAPWITARDLARADSAAAVADFLPGGRYAGGREDLTPDTDTDAPLTLGSMPRSEPLSDVSGPGVVSGGEEGLAVADLVEQVAAEGIEEQRYTIAQACAVGIIRKSPGAARQYKSAWIKAGKDFPEGEVIRGVSCYTRAELESVFGSPGEENADAD